MQELPARTFTSELDQTRSIQRNRQAIAKRDLEIGPRVFFSASSVFHSLLIIAVCTYKAKKERIEKNGKIVVRCSDRYACVIKDVRQEYPSRDNNCY